MIGIFSMVQQALILREFFVIAHGNELSWGMCLGNWLLGVFLGSWLGGILLHRMKNPESPFIPALCLLSLTPLPVLFFTRVIHWIHSTPYGAYLTLFGIFGFSALAMIPISFFIGFLFPLMGQLSGSKSNRASLSSLYALEASGSFIGGLAYTLFFVGRIPAAALSITLTLLLLITLLLYTLKTGSKKSMLSIAFLFLFFLGSMVTGGLHRLDVQSTRLRWKSVSPGRLVESLETKYQSLQLGEESGQWHIYANGQLQSIFPDTTDSRILAAHLVCQNPRSRSILLIGGGLTGLAQSMMVPHVGRITVIETDARFVDLLRRTLPKELSRLFNDSRLHILTGDARRILLKNFKRNVFDTAYLDLPPPGTTQLNRFYTFEFFKILRRALGPTGTLAVNLLPMETYSAGESGRYNALMFHTLKKLFPDIVISTGPRPMLFASGTPGTVSSSPAVLAGRFNACRLQPASLARLFSYFYEMGKSCSYLEQLDQIDEEINLDSRPMGYYLYNRLIGWYSGSKISPLLDSLENAHALLWLIPLLIALAPVSISKAFAKGRRSSEFILKWSAALAGFCCMTLEVLLIHLFQNRFGIVYHTIGVIVACFMAGLAAGAGLIPKNRSAPGLLKIQEFPIHIPFTLIAVLALLLPVLRSSRWLTPAALYILIFLTGSALGGFIPAAIRLMISSRGIPAASAAGAVNAGDHLGSAAGAFLSAAVFLPLLGFNATLFLVAGISIIPAIFLYPISAYFVPES